MGLHQITVVIELENIAHTFNVGTSQEIVALHEVNLIIPDKQFLVLVGSNGSGKSTLLNILAGTIIPTHGKIIIDGKDLTHHKDCKRSHLIARVFQNPSDGTASDLSIVENFRLASLRNARKSLRIGLDSKFEQRVKDEISELGLGLENKIHQAMGSLSGGQRQALCLLMAVMTDLKVLLLDEPTAALDPKSANVVLEIADKLVRKYSVTTVMVTHHLKEAHHFGDRVIQMQDGVIVKDLQKTECQKLSLSDMYNWFS